MKIHLRLLTRSLIALLACSLCFRCVETVLGQESQEQQQLINVFQLQKIEAESALDAAKSLFADTPGIAMSADPRANTLVVRANREILQQIQALLEILDQPESQTQHVMTLQIGKDKSHDIVRALHEFDLATVQMAATSEGTLILRGNKEDVTSVQELIQKIGNLSAARPLDVSVELIWLTEQNSAGGQLFEGSVAEQLAKRGFENLFVLSELEVTTRVGGVCEASGAAGLGKISSEIHTSTSDDKIVLQLQMDAQYLADDQQAGDIRFSTQLTTPVDRWIVFGVAQRQSKPSANANRSRDLFLIRVKELTPLRP